MLLLRLLRFAAHASLRSRAWASLLVWRVRVAVASLALRTGLPLGWVLASSSRGSTDANAWWTKRPRSVGLSMGGGDGGGGAWTRAWTWREVEEVVAAAEAARVEDVVVFTDGGDQVLVGGDQDDRGDDGDEHNVTGEPVRWEMDSKTRRRVSRRALEVRNVMEALGLVQRSSRADDDNSKVRARVSFVHSRTRALVDMAIATQGKATTTDVGATAPHVDALLCLRSETTAGTPPATLRACQIYHLDAATLPHLLAAFDAFARSEQRHGT